MHVVVSVFLAPDAEVKNVSGVQRSVQNEWTYMIQQLDRHLDIRRLASDNNQPLPFSSTCGCRGSVHPYTDCTRLHYLDLTCAHVADLVDLAASLSYDTSYKVVRDINLLSLELLGRVMLRWWRP